MKRAVLMLLVLIWAVAVNAQTNNSDRQINETKQQESTQNFPKTPTEAYDLASEPVNDWYKSKEATLEGNIKANEEKEKRAIQYTRYFKLNDWKGLELYNLAQLYLAAKQLADAESAFNLYLKSPDDDKTVLARAMLLSVLLTQKKIDKAIPVAEQLLNEPKYTQDIIVIVQNLIDVLIKTDVRKAIAISEKRLPNLIKYSEANIANANHVAKILDYALDLNLLYLNTGDTAKSKEFINSFLLSFNSSPLASNKRIKESVDSALLRQKLIGTNAPRIEGVEYIDMPKTDFPDLKGKVVLLDFLAHWCAPCIASFPLTNALKEKYESKGLVIIGVTSYYGFFGDQENVKAPDELALLKNLKAKRSANFGFVVGPRTNELLYGVAGLPAVALIDRAGKIRYIKQGADYKKEIESVIQRLIDEKVKD